MIAEDMLEAYRLMMKIRVFEETAAQLYANGEIPGFVHLSVGQEASAVGACWALKDQDVITSTHRGHGHAIAKGLEIDGMIAELMARETGTCRGRGGSMHIADPSIGIFGANGIVAAGLPIAVGAAFAARFRARGNVVLAFFGDGAVAQGAFHEAVNLAALWKLPIIFLCENNGFSEFSRTEDQHSVTLDTRAAGYGIPFTRLDGDDIEAVADSLTSIIESIRTGGGPHIVETLTVRARGHYEGDQQKYRAPQERPDGPTTDCIARTRQQLTVLGVSPSDIDGVEVDVRDEVQAAVERARKAVEPATDTLLDFVYGPTAPRGPFPEREPTTSKMRYSRAVREALRDALLDDERVFLAGIDVAAGNVFGLTRGLADEFPGRVLDTPISEIAITGLGVGAAMAGLRPVTEIMYLDFITVCMDQIVNQAAKLRYMTGGAATLPMVIRTQFGAGRSSGSQHSQSLEALLAHIPGLTIVMPSSAADAYALLRSSIDEPGPVVFIEHRLLYERESMAPTQGERLPLGTAAIVRPGKDATIVSWSRMVTESLAAAERLALEGIDVEVIDLRTIAPLDRTTILESLQKTSRLFIAQEAVEDFGVGAEIAAMAANEGFWLLDAPVMRLGAKSSPAPYAPSLERVWLPSAVDIADGVRRQVNM